MRASQASAASTTAAAPSSMVGRAGRAVVGAVGEAAACERAAASGAALVIFTPLVVVSAPAPTRLASAPSPAVRAAKIPWLGTTAEMRGLVDAWTALRWRPGTQAAA
jgi:hypothetical protein